MLRESCFYRRLTDTSKDEENQEESEELQEDMLGGITFFFNATNFQIIVSVQIIVRVRRYLLSCRN